MFFCTLTSYVNSFVAWRWDNILQILPFMITREISHSPSTQ
uniref:Uncharacterized protein n=1 Tax=Anguilla anguilla TaxID=7936 RepID=A0A0E9RU79_ANGAN